MILAAEELRRQAEAGDANAQYLLALKFYKGSGEVQDPRQGFLWMKVSAEGGCLKAQKALGLLYTSAQHAPFPNEDPQEAIRMYYLAAEQGDAEAPVLVGEMLSDRIWNLYFGRRRKEVDQCCKGQRL